MGVFFETPRATQPVRDALALALLKAVPANAALAQKEAEQPAAEVAGNVGGVGSIKWRSFLVATALLAIVAAAAIGAEAAKWTTATEQLWAAFKTILGIVVGFIGGEATGAGSKP
jgi:hypothetical protein